MSRSSRAVLTTLAGLATLCAAPAALAVDRPGFDPGVKDGLDGMPVHVVVVDERVGLQAPLLVWSDDPEARQHVLERAEVSGYGRGPSRVVDLLGAGVLGDDPATQLRTASQPLAAPWAALRAAGCDLPTAAATAPAIEAAVRATTWGAAATVQRHGPLARGASEAEPHYEFEVRHALTPDLAALVTTVLARAHGPKVAHFVSVWENRPTWTNELVIVSDAVEVGAKTDADRAEAVAREMARYRATNIRELAKKANEGDMEARQEGFLINQEHERAMREARSPRWVWQDAAARRVGAWTGNGCARVREALQANTAEATRVLGLLYAGQLRGLTPDWTPGRPRLLSKDAPPTRNVATGAAAAERRLYSDGPNIVVSRRAGDDVLVDFRYVPVAVDGG